MDPSVICARYCRTFVFLFLTILLFSPSAATHAQESRDLIVVIDVSTSMIDLFDQAKIESKQLVSSAQLGDRITIITFGKSARLLERMRIRSSSDIARALSILEELEATDYSTNLPAGMEFGLRELRQFYEDDPDSRRLLMWLSDDKSNPPTDVPELITFASLKERQTDQMPDQNWFEFAAPIEPEAKSDVQWFVDWASRSAMVLNAEFLTGDLGTIFVPELEREIVVNFEPTTEAMRESSFSVVAEIADSEGGHYSASIPVSPSIIVCKGTPWQETIRFMFPERAGSYQCRISFVLPSDELLKISPPQVSLKVNIQPSINPIGEQIAAIDAVIVAGMEESIQKRAPTERAFAPKMRSELLKNSGSTGRRASLLFGPVVPRGEYQVSTPLAITKNVSLDSLSMRKNFELPRGLTLLPDFRISDGTLFADLSLTAEKEIDLAEGWEILGEISFLSRDEGATIFPATVPIKLYSRKGLAKWGKRELQTGSTFEQIATFMHKAKPYVTKVGQALLVLLGISVLLYLVKRYGFASTQLEGTLEAIRNPSDHKIKVVNLRRMGKLRATSSLVIGSSRKADIVLPHNSVTDMHVKITTARTSAGTVVFVQPLHHNQIIVNDIAYTNRKELGDKDLLTIGEFVFLYKCPEIQRETIVRYLDGRSIRGILVSWDIDNPSFEFLPKGAPSLDAKMVIDFADLKAVFFVRKASRFSSDRFFGYDLSPSGRPIEVIFKDEELLEGYLIGETGEWSKRFYLVPKDRGEIAMILIERSAVQNTFMREPFEKPRMDIRKTFRSLFGRV